jgi:ubiquinone/menaquinone biosynthesis C-methylase UbiE
MLCANCSSKPRQATFSLLVVATNQRAELAKILRCSTTGIRLLCSDIDWRLDVDILCDAHDLPFQNESFDAIITTAVLEHVLYPERVVSELHRVLKPSGLLYSELPFMQQVHEGAFDFSRYTLSGHRRLLHAFTELDAGMIAGPGTALAWALEHFFLAFARRSISRSVSRLFARLVFSWVKYFDYFFRMRPAALDGASCTFFLGRRSETIVSDEAIVAAYFNSEA